MDVLRFINSKDIRKHLESIGYEFTSLEAAWLIRRCRSAAIAEKHAAWEELIAAAPDCEIPPRRWTIPQKSLHAFLKKYMELENELIARFYESDPGGEDCPAYVYRFRYHYEDGSAYDWPETFSLFEALYESAMEPEKDVVSITCVKTQLDLGRFPITAELTPEFDFVSIDPWEIENKEENDIFFGVFDGMWFDFPTPFKKGDILWDPDRREGLCGGPFVVTGVCLDGIVSKSTKEHIRRDGDATDMIASGYFAGPDGSIYYESTNNYMDLELYEGELTGPSRTLIPVSSFLKGKIDAGLYARAYHQIMMRNYTESCMPKDYSDPQLMLSGLLKSDRPEF